MHTFYNLRACSNAMIAFKYFVLEVIICGNYFYFQRCSTNITRCGNGDIKLGVDNTVKDTVMQIEKALINDRLRVSEVF